ncbi:hypothetical protein ACFYYH_23460 [Streptomyces sp. NPDC002018]|uniref:hypothetical protein n=1 Tax=Streptomyces sp. NPDC002018 TaxID=3364629 RepID=UPI00368331C6
MAQRIDQRQQAVVSHRMTFWGSPSGNGAASWEYTGQKWVVKRPDDGNPPFQRTVRCEECGKALSYAVHSVGTTRRRRFRRLLGAYAGLAVLLGSLAGFLTLGDAGTARTVGTVAAFFLGAVLGWVCGLAAAEEKGVTGHFVGWPGPTKHDVTLVEPPPEELPELVCARCGHREEFPQGKHYRKGFVQKHYRAAVSRLENHTCGNP